MNQEDQNVEQVPAGTEHEHEHEGPGIDELDALMAMLGGGGPRPAPSPEQIAKAMRFESAINGFLKFTGWDLISDAEPSDEVHVLDDIRDLAIELWGERGGERSYDDVVAIIKSKAMMESIDNGLVVINADPSKEDETTFFALAKKGYGSSVWVHVNNNRIINGPVNDGDSVVYLSMHVGRDNVIDIIIKRNPTE